MQNDSIVLFTDGVVSLNVPVSPEADTVWLSANQMAILFDKDEKTIRKHINNVFSDEELEKMNNTQKMRIVGVKQTVPFYTLDVIISVGYRVKSKSGIAFRHINNILKDRDVDKERKVQNMHFAHSDTRNQPVIDLTFRSHNPEIAGHRRPPGAEHVGDRVA